MGRSEYWAKAKVVREQAILFSPTLDSMISPDHEVRLLDEVLRHLNWSEWEAHYPGGRGQPPIRPRVLAGIWLYGMMRRIRTSRPLEYACGHNIDFMWLAEGLIPDHSGFILDAVVVNIVNEHPEALPAVDRTTQMCGASPETFLADGGMATGPIMAGLESREITGYVPVKSNEPGTGNPARRDDLTVPVPEHQWPNLPRNPQGQLDKSCFTYVAERDEYHCPQGRTLVYESRKTRNGVVLFRYKSLSCEGCPLVSMCLSRAKKSLPEQHSQANGRVRSIRRDEHEEVRQRTAVRMATESTRKQFRRRSSIAETPFGYLKGVLGLRRFRHRGLEKVDHEWRWSCLSLNVKKLLGAFARWKGLGAMTLNLEFEQTRALIA